MLKYIGYLFLLPVSNPCSILFKKRKASTYWSLFICWSSLPTGKYRIEFSGALAQKDLQARVPVPGHHHPHCWLLTVFICSGPPLWDSCTPQLSCYSHWTPHQAPASTKRLHGTGCQTSSKNGLNSLLCNC